MFSVVTSRFTNETLEKNYNYRNKNKLICIYNSPTKLSPKITYDAFVFVVEMNNSLNKIEGIGMIRNKSDPKNYYKVYEIGNINRYTYIGTSHINRDYILSINPDLVFILDKILFTGYTHSKRGSGLTLIPEKLLKQYILEGFNIKMKIQELFITLERK
jgi:hypothetical protein